MRVFVSSPGDLRAERTIADRLIRTTAEELGIPVSVQFQPTARRTRFIIALPRPFSGTRSTKIRFTSSI